MEFKQRKGSPLKVACRCLLRKIHILLWVFLLWPSIALPLSVPTDKSVLKSDNALGQQANFKIWDDGTVYVRGQVEEHNKGCEVDGECYLRLHIDSNEIRVIYNEGDVQQICINNQASYAQNMKQGDWIKAFGAYSKRGNVIIITTCGSADSFIRYADQGTPVGLVTERFFDEVEKLKGQIAQQDFKEAQKSGKWITYKNAQLGYEFSYPATWLSAQTSPDAAWSVYYPRSDGDSYFLTLGYISQAQLATMGVDFCGANSGNSRCESRKIGEVTAIIDRGDNTNRTVFVKIPRSQGGIITFSLQPNSKEAESLFWPILDTFKFNR